MKIDKNKLSAKGWTEEEILNAEEILAKAEEKKHPGILLAEKFSYWFLFTFIIITAVTMAWVIQPLILFSSKPVGLIIVGISGFLFGTFASLILRMLEKIELKHYIILSLIIPIVGIITSFLLEIKVNQISEMLKLSTYSPMMIAITYTICCLIPYVTYLILERRKADGTL